MNHSPRLRFLLISSSKNIQNLFIKLLAKDHDLHWIDNRQNLASHMAQYSIDVVLVDISLGQTGANMELLENIGLITKNAKQVLLFSSRFADLEHPIRPPLAADAAEVENPAWTEANSAFQYGKSQALEAELLPQAGRKNGPANDYRQVVDRVERQLILQSLRRNRWNKTRTCQEMGISRSKLYKKMSELGIDY